MELIPGKKYTCTLLKKSEIGLMAAVKLSDDSFRLIPKTSIIFDYIDGRIGKRLTFFIAPKNDLKLYEKLPSNNGKWIEKLQYDPFTKSYKRTVIPDFNNKLV